MALSNSTQELLRTQYYDDYYAVSNTDPTITRGEDFDFHRILFRPRFAVQSRELTQLQTLLNVQLERLGKSQFKDGDSVLGGGLTLDTSVISGQVLPTTNLLAMFDRTTNNGQYIFDKTDQNIKAHVLQFVSADEGVTSNSYLIFKQQTGNTFLPGTVVQSAADPTITATFVTGNSANVFSSASVVSIDDGVYFVEGFFVRVAKQTIVLDPFSDLPSFRIGLEIAEQVLDELDDVVGATLLDPANQNAVGAHRLRIKLTLGKRTLDTSADAAFIELARVINGKLQRGKLTPRFVRIDELNDILAKRTFDEAGDFLVKHFTPVIDVNPDDANTFLLSLGPGSAFVRGYEIETTETNKEVIRKGRATQDANNRTIPLPVGNFVYATRVVATEPINYFANTAVVDIHCVNVASLAIDTSGHYNYSRIGQAKIRMLEPWEVPNSPALFANNSEYKLFFYDVVGDNLSGNVVSASQNNNVAITCVLPIANGTPSVNDAIDGVTIVLGGASSPVTGTFTVNNYVVAPNGTHAFTTLVEFLPTLPNNNTTYKLIFQTKDVDCFAVFDGAVSAIVAPYKSNLAFQADVHINSKLANSPIGATIVSDTNDNVLLYQIPETFVTANTITADTAIFKSWIKTTSNVQSFAAVQNTDFTIVVSGANFSLPVGSLSATTAQENFIIFDQTNDANGHGQVIQFEDGPTGTDRCVSNVVVTPSGSNYNITFTYHFGAVTSTTRSLIGLAKATVAGFPVRQKTLILANTSNVQTSTASSLNAGQIEFYSLNASAGFAYSLKVPDVFRIKKVLYKSSNTAFTNDDLTTATDVTAQFTLDNGQRDNTYEYASLIVGSGASGSIQPTGRLLVFFDWFKNTGRGYATVDSYVNASNASRGMTYDLVPDYTSVKFNRKVSLRDVLDFRPMRSHTEFAAAPLIFASNDASTNTTYLTSTADSYLIPVSDDTWFGSYEFYLARIDKVGLAFDGTFHVIEGQDATAPKAPQDEAGTLLLFQLNVPPYTLVDANGVPTTVLLQTFDHKRYTMQDISKMDDRVSHLEYYTMLNSLETLTKNAPITDSGGNDRFKNGIVVDGFHGGETGDINRPDFTASLDTTAGELRTAYRDFVMQFAPDTANATTFGITLVGDMAIPSYNTTPFITQSLATHAVSVNPFDVASFYGTVKLNPAVDIWKDVENAPAQVVDLGGPSQTWTGAAPSFTNWGEWDQTWSGVTAVTPRNQFFTPPGWTPDNHAFRSESQLSWNDVTTATQYQRQGTQFEFNITTTTADLGNKVVDVSIVHNIRNRDVVFAADGIKPGSTMYAFFDGEPVTQYVQQADVIQLADQAVVTVPFYLGQTVYVQKALTGNVAVASGFNTLTGTGTAFLFELVPGQLVRVTQGVQTFDSFVSGVTGDGAATMTVVSGVTLAAATLYSLTPVTVADIASRVTGSVVQYTLKVVRAIRDAATDAAVPYALTAGCLRPEKMVKDTANTTTGAVVIAPASAQSAGVSININSAVCHSGIVRSYNAGTAALRFDLDITDAAVATPGTTVYFVSGPGAGTSAKIVSYDPTTQTAILDNSGLAITTSTIYSVGTPVADGFIANNAVTSGRAGTVSGVFHIPNAAFAVGTRLFRLTDQANNIIKDATSTAETNYVASGVSYTQQDTTVTSRSLGLVRGGPQTETKTITDTTVQDFSQQYIDPLAETFLVDDKIFPQGVFITSVDFCFAAKPTDDIPVILEIRPVVNGYPSSNQLVPCVSASSRAQVTLRPDAVKVSTVPSFDNVSTVTTFTLPAPVMLMPGREYAIIIRSDSDLYTVYTAELGSAIIGSDAKVAKQPYAGSFFKSQNASTWTESPFEDLMFRINRALWTGTTDTPQVAALIARGVAPAANATFDSYEFYPHDVTFGPLTTTGYTFDVKPFNNATQDLTGEIAVRYNVQPAVWSLLSARSMVQGYDGLLSARPYPFGGPLIPAANTIDAICTLTTFSTDIAPYVDMQKINVLCVRHLLNNMDLANTGVIVVNPGAGYLANLQTGGVTTVGGSNIVTGNSTANFSTTLLSGDTVVVGGNLEIIVASVTNSSQFIATSNVSVSRAANVFYTYSAINGTGNVAISVSDGNGSGANGTASVSRSGKITGVLLSANGSGYTGTPTVTVPAPTAPGGSYTLPQTTALLGYNSELNPTGGNSLTRYIIRQVTLADGFDARDIRVTFDAYRPLGSHFYVYYAVLPGDDDKTRFQDVPWRLMDMETADSVVSTGYYQFKEFNFTTPNNRALDAPTDTTDKFKVFAIKVVVAGDDTVDVPRIANFRAIALDA